MIRKLLFLAFFIAAALGLFAQSRQGPFTGVITETMCGADHKMMGNTPPAKCTVDCVKSNPSKVKYALLVGKDVYVLSDQQTPEKFAAQKVKVTGTLYEKTRIIEVKSIEPAR